MRYIAKTLGMIAAVATIGACSLKEELPYESRETFYKDESACISMLYACYNPLTTIYNYKFLMVTEFCSDTWYTTTSNLDAALSITPAKPEFGATVWRQCYVGIERCNEAYHFIGLSSLDEGKKKQLMAEAVVMRAFYYYTLTCTFGGVPFYLDYVADMQAQDDLRYLPRSNADEIRARLYEDIEENALPYFTEENGLKVRECDAPQNRSGYALGLMLQAKFAIWNKDWKKCLKPLQALEELYGEFNETRYPLEETAWHVKNCAESIFEVQHSYDLTGVKVAGNCAVFMCPPHAGSGMFDGLYMPEIGENLHNVTPARTNRKFAGMLSTGAGMNENNITKNNIFGTLPLTYDYLDPSISRYRVKIDMEAIQTGMKDGKKLDRRGAFLFGLGNLKTGETFSNVAKNGRLWGGPKFWCPDIYYANDDNNYRIFRYADVILMLAECWCELGDSDKALSYLNMVRDRAGAERFDAFESNEALMEEIRNERARELTGEFQRKFDLVRWGIWYERTKEFTDNTSLKNRMRPCHRYYPIPDTQCALSGYILNNPEYEAEQW